MRTDVYIGQDRPKEAHAYIVKRKHKAQPSSRVTIVSGPDHLSIHLSDEAFNALALAMMLHLARKETK